MSTTLIVGHAGGVVVVCRRGIPSSCTARIFIPSGRGGVSAKWVGKIEGDDACTAARRELAEESGVAMNTLRECGWSLSRTNRRTNAKLHVVYGEYSGVDYQHNRTTLSKLSRNGCRIADVVYD